MSFIPMAEGLRMARHGSSSAARTLLDSLGVPVTESVRRTGGAALHCVEAGPEDGPPVVLLHGFPEFWWGWRRQIPALASAGFRVIVPDQRGYNLSDKPAGPGAYALDILARDVIGLADAYGLERIGLVGHDWGGLVAWWAASRHPDRIERLVAVNAPHPSIVQPYLGAHPGQILKSLYVGFFHLPHVPEAMLSADRHRALARALTDTSRPGTFSEADLSVYREAWSQPGALTAMLNWYRALPLIGRIPVAGRLPMPVQVLWGMKDRFLEFGLAQSSLALCDRGSVRRFGTATHWVHLEEAGALNSALLGFLNP